MAGNSNPEISIGITNASLPLETHATYGIRDWRRLQKKIDADRGMEFHPVRGRLYAEIASTAFMLQNERDGLPLVSSYHQSFLEASKNNLKNCVYRKFMPTAHASLKMLEKVNHRLRPAGRPILNVYPDTLPNGESYDTGAFQVISQLYPALWERFWSDESHDVFTQLGNVGVLGYCGDTVHSRKTSISKSQKMPSWVDLWPQVTANGQMAELHISLGRIDMKAKNPALAGISMREYDAFTRGGSSAAKGTDIAYMLAAVKENMPPDQKIMPAIIEVSPAVMGRDALGIGNAFGRIVDNIRDVWEDA